MADPAALQSQARMDLAESLTDASRSLDRTRRRIERVIAALDALRSPEITQGHIERCRLAVVEVEQINNAIRKMNI